MNKEINKLEKENHKLFKVIDKCTGQNDSKCNNCLNKCMQRLIINNNIVKIRLLMINNIRAI